MGLSGSLPSFEKQVFSKLSAGCLISLSTPSKERNHKTMLKDNILKVRQNFWRDFTEANQADTYGLHFSSENMLSISKITQEGEGENICIYILKHFITFCLIKVIVFLWTLIIWKI